MSIAYDRIWKDYARHRRADSRVAAFLMSALDGAQSVLNVGAGTGSYEPTDRVVVAVEPSVVMISQRPHRAAPAVRGRAEALPFANRAFDAVMAVLTTHHWTDRTRGLAECARVARDRVVLFTWDPAADGFWLVQDYLPQFIEADRRQFPNMIEYEAAFRSTGAHIEVVPVPTPSDCIDGFLGAFWARPTAYLDETVRSGISSFARPGAEEGLDRLREDLSSGAWHARYGHLLAADALDMGYRVVVARLNKDRVA